MCRSVLNGIKKIKQHRVKNANNIIIGHLNINSFRNKFVFAEEIIQVFDMFLVCESKLYNTIHFQQTFSELTVTRFLVITEVDLGGWGGGVGLFLCVNERVSCRLLQGHPSFPELEIFVLEIYQNNRKLLFLGVYKPPNQNDIEFLNRIGAITDYYSQKYNVTIIGDFNIATENTHYQSMMQAYNVNNLIKEPTCFQSNNPNQTYLILTNQKNMYRF